MPFLPLREVERALEFEFEFGPLRQIEFLANSRRDQEAGRSAYGRADPSALATPRHGPGHGANRSACCRSLNLPAALAVARFDLAFFAWALSYTVVARNADHIGHQRHLARRCFDLVEAQPHSRARSEEHTSELQSRLHLVCRLLLEKKKSSWQICLHIPMKAERRPDCQASV